MKNMLSFEDVAKGEQGADERENYKNHIKFIHKNILI